MPTSPRTSALFCPFYSQGTGEVPLGWELQSVCLTAGSCLARGLMLSLPGSHCRLQASNPEMMSNNNVTLGTKIQGPYQPPPSRDRDQQGRVAAATARAQWGVGGETSRAPTDPKKGAGASVRMCTGKVHPT